LIPILNFYDHGIPTILSADIQPELIEAYRQTTQGKSSILKAGDEIKLRTSGSPSVRVQVLAASGAVVGEQPGAPQIRPCGPAFKPNPEDKTDNANSIGFLLSFGRFSFFDGGDLTWNVEHKLSCPKNLPGVVDVYQVDHHGSDSSNNPALVLALKPRVAIIDNGPQKGGEARTFATLKSVPGIEAIYQLHRNVRTTERDNAPADYVANDEEACHGEFIKLSVNENGKTYSVSIPGKQISRDYKVR